METTQEEAVGRREAEGRPGPGLAPRLRHDVMALRPRGHHLPRAASWSSPTPGGEKQAPHWWPPGLEAQHSLLWWTLYSLSQYYGNTCTQCVTRIYQLYTSFFECIKFKIPVNHPQTISLNKIVLFILTDHLFSILLHTESDNCSVVSHSLWPLNCSPPGPSVHGMVQARILECGLPFLSPGDRPNPGIEPRSPALQADSLPSEWHITHYQTWNSAAGESMQTKAGRGCSSRDLAHCHFQWGQETSWRARSQTQTYITQQSGKGCKTLCGHS